MKMCYIWITTVDQISFVKEIYGNNQFILNSAGRPFFLKIKSKKLIITILHKRNLEP